MSLTRCSYSYNQYMNQNVLNKKKTHNIQFTTSTSLLRYSVHLSLAVSADGISPGKYLVLLLIQLL